MRHALFIDLGAPGPRSRTLRAALEARGWETSTFTRPAPPRGPDAWLLRARWLDCHLAVVLRAPTWLIQTLQRRAPRPVLKITDTSQWVRHARTLP